MITKYVSFQWGGTDSGPTHSVELPQIAAKSIPAGIKFDFNYKANMVQNKHQTIQ